MEGKLQQQVIAASLADQGEQIGLCESEGDKIRIRIVGSALHSLLKKSVTSGCRCSRSMLSTLKLQSPAVHETSPAFDTNRM
jgi:hypothetical protein